ICVMVSSIYEIRKRIEHKKAADLCVAAVWLYTAFMVTARAISGVHWLSDIIGGILLSIILLSLYYLLIGTNK
ncbi:MAG: phosphatase PAP2 family protein, partial [Bacteroidales bacterium]|nr:phosphatase PAP2 family protein [Bacteroidales bacterium]